MNLEHKSFLLELKLDAESRRISGYASTFNNTDSVGDIVMPGAFSKTLGKRKIKMLYQHETHQLIGVWDVAKEDDKGLYVEGTFANTPLGNEAYELAKIGALDAMSIGYRIHEAEYNKDGIRMLKDIEAFEVSLVTFPANEKATIDSVKSLDGVPFDQLFEHKDKIEAALRNAGASKSAAQYIASLVKPPALRDAKGDEAELAKHLDSFANLFINK